MKSNDVNPVSNMAVRWWYGDHDPTSSETTTNGTVQQYDNYINLNSGKLWMNTNATINSMSWSRCGNSAMSNPISVSLSFGTSRTPNSTYDTHVTLSLSQTSTVLLAADVLFQINYGSGFVTIGEHKLSGLAANIITTCTYPIPAGTSYQIINNSGTNAIVYLNEVTA